MSCNKDLTQPNEHINTFKKSKESNVTARLMLARIGMHAVLCRVQKSGLLPGPLVPSPSRSLPDLFLPLPSHGSGSLAETLIPA